MSVDLCLVNAYRRRKLEGALVVAFERMAANGVAIGCGKAIAGLPSPDVLLRMLVLHVARGYSLRETIVRAKLANSLLQTLYSWNQIAQALAEQSRNRLLQLAK